MSEDVTSEDVIPNKANRYEVLFFHGWPAKVAYKDAQTYSVSFQRFLEKKPVLMSDVVVKQESYDPASRMFTVSKVFRPDIKLAFHLRILWIIFKHRAKKMIRAFAGR